MKRILGPLAWLGLGLAIGTQVYPVALDRDTYRTGHDAYRNANCPKAIAAFDRLLDRPRAIDWGRYAARARQQRAECQSFAAARQADLAEDDRAAFAGYLDFTARYPRSYLHEAARNRLDAIAERGSPESLASAEGCAALGPAEARGDLRAENPDLPLLYLTCGRLFRARGDRGEALHLFDVFLQKYDGHPLSGLARQDMQDLLAEISERGLRPGDRDALAAVPAPTGDRAAVAADPGTGEGASDAGGWGANWLAGSRALGRSVRETAAAFRAAPLATLRDRPELAVVLLATVPALGYALAVAGRALGRKTRRRRSRSRGRMRRGLLANRPQPNVPEAKQLAVLKIARSQEPKELDPALENKLLGMVAGDRRVARRLVAFERTLRPGMAENWYWQAAIDRIVRDRCS